MLTEAEVREIVAAITYKPGWTIGVFNELSGGLYIQASVSTESDLTMDPTRRTADRTPWKTGKRYLSRFMCRQEIVGTVFGLIKDAETHETHEWFRYRNASIFNPHLDPDVLVTIARKASSFNVRENAMSMDEITPTTSPTTP